MIKAVVLAQALADETRWRILNLLEEQAMCACELVDILQMRTSTVSSHLQVLRRSDWLDQERCGKWIYSRVRLKHLPLLQQWRQHFTDDEVMLSLLKMDRLAAEQRLALREQSCCPLPQKLQTRLK